MSAATPSHILPQERLQALYQIIERMNSVYELPELLAFILDRVLEHTGGRRGYLLLVRQPITVGALESLRLQGAASPEPRLSASIM